MPNRVWTSASRKTKRCDPGCVSVMAAAEPSGAWRIGCGSSREPYAISGIGKVDCPRNGIVSARSPNCASGTIRYRRVPACSAASTVSGPGAETGGLAATVTGAGGGGEGDAGVVACGNRSESPPKGGAAAGVCTRLNHFSITSDPAPAWWPWLFLGDGNGANDDAMTNATNLSQWSVKLELAGERGLHGQSVLGKPRGCSACCACEGIWRAAMVRRNSDCCCKEPRWPSHPWPGCPKCRTG